MTASPHTARRTTAASAPSPRPSWPATPGRRHVDLRSVPGDATQPGGGQPSGQPFRVEVSCVADRWTLALAGDLDLATGADLVDLGRVLASGAPGEVLLDLADLGFIDSAGLQALVQTCALIRSAGGHPHVAGPAGPALRRLLLALDRAGVHVHLDQLGAAA